MATLERDRDSDVSMAVASDDASNDDEDDEDDEEEDKVDFAEDIIANDLLCRLIFSYCTPGSIICLGKTCRVGYAAAADYARSAYDINRSLSRFFKDPLAFRSLQARTGMLISGSFALQFFGRQFYPESDLDLYVAMHARKEVGRWILDQGYEYVPYEHQADIFDEAVDGWVEHNAANYPMRGMAGVFTFVKTTPEEDPTREDKVQLIVASRSPVEVVLAFHCTLVMNIISYDKAFCLYPKATFEQQRALVTDSKNHAKRQRALDKYRARGWDFAMTLRWPEFHFDHPQRWVCDKYAWVMSLNTDGVVPPGPPSYCHPLLVSNWTLERNQYCVPKMRFDVLIRQDRLFPIVNTDPLVWDMVARMLGQDKHDIRGGPYWNDDDDEGPREIATEQSVQTQEVVQAVFAFQMASKRVQALTPPTRRFLF